jgi:hypothetical protein
MHIFFDFTNDTTQRAFLLDHALQLLKEGFEVLWVDGVTVNRILSAQPFTEFLFSRTFQRKYVNLWNHISHKNSNFRFIELFSKDFHDDARVNFEEMPNIEELIKHQIIIFQKDSEPCMKHSQKLVKSFRFLSYAIDTAVRRTLSEFPKASVYVFNGRFLPEAIVASRAKEHGFKLSFIETFAIDWRDRYWIFEQPVHSSEYRSEVMSRHSRDVDLQILKDVGSNWMLNRKTGVSQNFTSKMSSRYNSESNKRKKIIVFFHSSEDELVTTNLSKSPWVSQFHAIKVLKEIVLRNNEWKLVVRVHPNLSTKSIREIRKWSSFADDISMESVEVIPYNSQVNSYDLLDQASIVVTFGSTSGVEAVLAGKISLLMSNAFHEPMGICQTVRSESEIEDVIKLCTKDCQSPSHESKKNAYAYGYFMATAGISLSEVSRKSVGSGMTRPVYLLNGVNLSNTKLYSMSKRLEGFVRDKIIRPYTCAC